MLLSSLILTTKSIFDNVPVADWLLLLASNQSIYASTSKRKLVFELANRKPSFLTKTYDLGLCMWRRLCAAKPGKLTACAEKYTRANPFLATREHVLDRFGIEVEVYQSAESDEGETLSEASERSRDLECLSDVSRDEEPDSSDVDFLASGGESGCDDFDHRAHHHLDFNRYCNLAKVKHHPRGEGSTTSPEGAIDG